MWVNALLMVKGAGFRIRSRSGLWALLLAATLAPLWDYGFEIRHDVPLLTATLALWCLVRRPGPAGVRFLLAGAVAAFMEMIAFKGFMYALPLLALGFHLERPRGPGRTLGRLGLVLAGLIAGLALGRVLHGLAGTWELAWTAFKDTGAYAANHVERFQPWGTLIRIFTEAPLLGAGALAALAVPLLPPRAGSFRAFLACEWFPEWCFAVLCLVLLLANPTPFPYNLLHLVPALTILLMRFREPIIRALGAMAPPARQMVVGALVILHVLPWAAATDRHVDMGNDRQQEVAGLAEAMTDPALHRVFDGSGLCSTRDPIGRKWIIHSFTISHFMDGSWPSVRSLLAQNPTPVILPNYRLYWLPKADHDFIRAHYLALADDFLVLGGTLEAGAPSWEALAAGRYRIDDPDGGPSPQVFGLDGHRLQPGVQVLARGRHDFQIPAGRRLRVAWVGPTLKDLPPLGPAPHPLYVNWY
jgi:hypothetical protein